MAKKKPRDLKPGERCNVERGIIAYRDAKGKLRYGITYMAEDAKGAQRRRLEMVGGLALARKALEAVKTDITRGVYEFPEKANAPTVGELCDEYLAGAKLEKSSWERDRGVIEAFKNFTGPKKITRVSADDVATYKMQRASETKDDGRRARGRASVNRELAIIKRLFAWAVEMGKLPVNPAQPVKLFKEDERPIHTLTDSEQGKLIQACRETPKASHLAPLVELALNTGMRRGELLQLDWSDVDLQQRVITICKSKSGRVRYIPLNRVALKALESLDVREGGVFTYGGRAMLTVRKSFLAAVKRAGIRTCRFHDLRHTFATNLVLMGVDLVTVQQLMGHAEISMTVRYTHPTPENKQRAVALLEGNTPVALESVL